MGFKCDIRPVETTKSGIILTTVQESGDRDDTIIRWKDHALQAIASVKGQLFSNFGEPLNIEKGDILILRADTEQFITNEGIMADVIRYETVMSIIKYKKDV